MKKIYLVDASSLFFRAYYAIRPLTSPSGLPTNAIYGFLSMILKLLKEEKPDYLVFCYDRKEPSFRKEIYNEYKATRSETPVDLIPQIPYIKKMADILGIPSLEIPRYEADDIIGALTKIARDLKLDVFIVSGDKDFGQLVDTHVKLYDTLKGIKYDPAGVKEKWGVEPQQIIDYMSLVGDASDNIPGVEGIGAKGAQKLIHEFGSLDGIYKNIGSIKGSLKEKLEKGKESAYLSKKLVSIETEIPLDRNIEAYHLKPIDYDSLKALLIELNFKNLEKSLEALPHFHRSELKSKDSTLLNDETKNYQLNQELETALKDKTAFFEKEIIESELSLVFKQQMQVWAWLTEHGLYLGDEETGCVYSLKGDPQNFAQQLFDFQFQWKGFDLKSFFHALRLENLQNFKPQNIIWDSMLAAYVIKAGEPMDFDRLYSRFTGELPGELLSPKDLFRRHLNLQKSLLEKLQQVQADDVVKKLEFPLISILYKMEVLGIELDQTFLKSLSIELTQDIQGLEKEITTLAGENFNIASPKQLAVILFDKLKLPVGKKTKTGYSTDSDVLEKLKTAHPIIDQILKFRELAKLKSTYVDALPLLVKEDGRLHTTLNQAQTTTGRLSSTEPNLQNIPIRTPRGALIRKAFVAKKDNFLLSVDYSQIELRILAHYSEDKNLCQAFFEDLDIHVATAAEVFSVPLVEVTPDMRRAAKAVNFGIAYGQGAFGLAENLGISRSESSEIIKKYFLRFPGVQSYISSTIEKAKEDGYVQTLFGRRRYIDEFQSANPAIKKFAERAAINAPIQGSASDIVKLAMIEIDSKVSLTMLLQVHDELIFEGTRDEILSNQNNIKKIMEEICPLKVPLKVNAAMGKNWDEAH